MKSLFFLCLILMSLAAQGMEGQAASAMTLYPEDGSLRMTHWFYSKSTYFVPSELEKIRSALESEDVKPVELDFSAAYLQDVMLFDDKGRVLIQAPMPTEPENILTGLTIAVFDFDRILTKIDVADTERMGLGSQKLDWTFVEGGGFISGKFSDGETYVLMTAAVIDRAKNFYEYLNKVNVSEEAIKTLIASDLNIKAENIFILPLSGHLDLEIMALPGGVLLLNDSSRVVQTLDYVLTNYSMSVAENEIIKSIRTIYTEGQQRFDYQGQPMGEKLFPDGLRPKRLEALDETMKILEKRFKVIRLAGRISQLTTYSNSSSLYITEDIDFFNGFTGKNASNETFVMTNESSGLPVLQMYWRDVLKTQGISSEHVHFVGRYTEGAGIDCAGAGTNLH